MSWRQLPAAWPGGNDLQPKLKYGYGAIGGSQLQLAKVMFSQLSIQWRTVMASAYRPAINGSRRK